MWVRLDIGVLAVMLKRVDGVFAGGFDGGVDTKDDTND